MRKIMLMAVAILLCGAGFAQPTYTDIGFNDISSLLAFESSTFISEEP